ncbi:MAG TPA: hypothetical protein VFU05_03125 [Cyclobacteriaceae bacterium]|nr:hypothetical protein [Cyclobacteriaceae bacterium]
MKLCVIILLSFMQLIAYAQNKTLGVGVTSPNPNAALHVESPTNNQGFIMPRLTTTQRLSMTLTPSDMGLMVYDITEKTVFTWDGTAWSNVTNGITGATARFAVTNSTDTTTALNVKSSGLGNKASAASFVSTSTVAGTKPTVYVNNATGTGISAETAAGWAIIGRVTAGQGNAVSGYTTSSDPGSWGGNFTAETGTAIYASTNSNVGGALAPVGVYGESTGTASVGGAFWIQNASNSYPALYANTIGTGPAFRGETATGFTVMQAAHTGVTGGAGQFEITNTGNSMAALDVSTVGTGAAIMAKNEGTGNGFAGLFINTNSGNTYPGVQIEVAGNGSNAMYINHTGASGNFVTYTNGGVPAARIGKNGIGYFNGGTQSSGADVAELFDVEGAKSEYEPGDVLVISESTDRTVEKSSTPVSTKIAGVYATKPGVVLTERELEANTDDLVPMGVVGVIPTKVCLENGPIKRGDLLVTSSIKGHAMKAKPVVINGFEIYPTGTILGKALENFESGDTGLIKVLVNVK